jgi:hypothetical protein
MTRIWHFYALAVAVGLVQGGSQALSRSLYGAMTPRTKTAEFFGFFNIMLGVRSNFWKKSDWDWHARKTENRNEGAVTVPLPNISFYIF